MFGSINYSTSSRRIQLINISITYGKDAARSIAVLETSQQIRAKPTNSPPVQRR